jgi:serine/threonine-protein kinase SRPK3
MEESESVGSWLTDSGVLLSDSSEHSWAASPLVASPAPPEAKEEDPESAEDYSDGEEEGTNGYRSGGYHPVKIGDVFKHQYVVEKKLGWGHFSTVWLASDLTKRDDDPRKCVALKIQKSAEHYTEAAMDEIEILEKIRDTDTKSSEYVVRLLDYFSHHGPNGKHVCMVFELLGQNLLWLIKKYNYKGIPVPIVKKIARDVLMGLDYMHRSCSVIHTDLKPENILLTRDHAVDIESIRAERLAAMTPKECRRDELAAQIAEQWTENGAKPLTKNQKKKLRKKLKKELSKDQDDAPSVVLKSSSLNDTPSKSNLRGKLNRSVFAKVADFGNACWTFRHFSDEIATRQYRAPEAIVGYDYNSSVDIWAYACVIFELVTGDYLFDPKQDSKGKFSRDEGRVY